MRFLRVKFRRRQKARTEVRADTSINRQWKNTPVLVKETEWIGESRIKLPDTATIDSEEQYMWPENVGSMKTTHYFIKASLIFYTAVLLE